MYVVLFHIPDITNALRLLLLNGNFPYLTPLSSTVRSERASKARILFDRSVGPLRRNCVVLVTHVLILDFVSARAEKSWPVLIKS